MTNLTTIKIPGIETNEIRSANITINNAVGRYIEATRPDGLTIFFDLIDEPWAKLLNRIRVYGNKQTVLLAVGIIKGFFITRNYADRYLDPNNTGDKIIQDYIHRLIDNIQPDHWNNNEYLVTDTIMMDIINNLELKKEEV